MADTTDLDSMSLDQLQALRAQMLQQQGGAGGGASSAPVSTAPATAAPATSAPSGPIVPIAPAPSPPASTPAATPSASSVTLAPGQSLDDLSLDQLQQMRAQMLAASPTQSASPAPQSTLQRVHQQLAAEGYQPSAAEKWLDQNVTEPISGFSEQLERAASGGLTDKVSAGVAALNNLVKRGWNAASGAPTTNEPSAGDAYQSELAQSRAQGDAYAAAHPYLSGTATTIGTVFGSAQPAAGVAIPTTLAGKIGQGIVGGGTLGAISGFGSPMIRVRLMMLSRH
jgi:hypothetical protein